MNTTTVPDTSTVEQRRAQAEHHALMARIELREAAKLLDDGDHPTGHRNALAALTAVDDVVDAVKGHDEADRIAAAATDEVYDYTLARWADEHGEDPAQMVAEAEGRI